jgi:2-dehydro-3-deoxygluconokinase
MAKICCFGELLFRMSPSLDGEWIQHGSMSVYIGGAELNVARALAKWGLAVKYVSAVPANYLSEEIEQQLNKESVEFVSLPSTGDRIGIYFLPEGKDLKNAGVIYDRAYSSFATLKPGTIDWKNILKDCTHFHFSAISPALNENISIICKEALEAATALDLVISVDLNYRAKLWQYGKKPIDIMPHLVSHCHIIMGNIWSAHELLGVIIDKDPHRKSAKEHYANLANITTADIFKQYPNCKQVANTFRFTNDGMVSYFATLHDTFNTAVSKTFVADKVVDPVGSGDCFMGALLYGNITKKYQLSSLISLAASAAYGKLAEKGDHTQQSIQQIESRI